MRVVIVDEEMGVYLGHCLGGGWWSLMDHVGQRSAYTFESVEDARAEVKLWPEPLSKSDRFRYIPVEADVDGEYASVHSMLNAGLGPKIGLMVLEEPAASVPDATRKWYVAGGIYTSLDWHEIEPGTFQFHGPFNTEKEADQCWRAEMSKKIDTCMHKLRVVSR